MLSYNDIKLKSLALNTSSDEELIELTLKYLLSHEKDLYDVLWDSMEYSVSAGGKRVRPRLTMEFAKLCKGDRSAAALFGCAVELIHTYSLIHDDLPCMDDDDMRRGKPSNHIAFSEDVALLAGDALQTLAFEAMLSPESIELIGADRACKAAHTLAKFAGADGMVGGQVIDLEYENKPADEDVISKIHSMKTGALIRSACMMGTQLAGGTLEQSMAAYEYGECIGLTFQIVDDILDVTATSEELGKPANSDLENNKSTLVSLFGIDKCKEIAKMYTERAITALECFEGDTTYLKEFALKLLNRKN